MKEKVKFLKDKNEFMTQITDDNIINITGMIGSGKSTTADRFRNQPEFIVINTDSFFIKNDCELNKETVEINKIIEEKYPELLNERHVEQHFRLFYNEILLYIKNNKIYKTCIIEGQHIYRFLDALDIKGTLIVKRTSILNCWLRSLKRGIDKYNMLYKDGKITKFDKLRCNLYNLKRRTKQVIYFIHLNKFLNSVS